MGEPRGTGLSVGRPDLGHGHRMNGHVFGARCRCRCSDGAAALLAHVGSIDRDEFYFNRTT